MHPLLQARRRFALYLALAAPLAAAMGGILARGPQGFPPVAAAWLGALLAVAALFLLLPVWYVCRAFPVASSPLSRLVPAHAVGGALTGTVWVYAGARMTHLLASYDPHADLPALYTSHTPSLLAGGALLYLLSAALHYMYLAMETAQRAERGAIEQAMLARESELRALKAQVHPHFLFNSLNSISSLTSSDPARAREMCILLSEFFRKSLAIGEKPSVSLDEELALAKTYLAIEGLRMGTRLSIEEAIEDDSRGCRLPPLLLQPLVENAVRHGIATCAEGGVLRLEARTEDARLRVSVQNPFDLEAPRRPGVGLGLTNVRRRLKAHYGERAAMDAHGAEGRFQVTLVMPAENES